MHKNRPLVKPFVITTTDSYTVDVMGPYLSNGKYNYASIIKHIVTSNSNGIMNFLKEDDVLIVDRGFRDAISFLNELGFKTQMPAFLEKSLKQHSTSEANMSRFVTKVRWVVKDRRNVHNIFSNLFFQSPRYEEFFRNNSKIYTV